MYLRDVGLAVWISVFSNFRLLVTVCFLFILKLGDKFAFCKFDGAEGCAKKVCPHACVFSCDVCTAVIKRLW